MMRMIMMRIRMTMMMTIRMTMMIED